MVDRLHSRCIIFLIYIYRTASELSALSGMIRRQLAELLRHYNSRCYQLVLGAGALQVAGLKTITSIILVLASRSLKLVLWLMPFVKAHFQGIFLLRHSMFPLQNQTISFLLIMKIFNIYLANFFFHLYLKNYLLVLCVFL
jgi:hypothetical protein